MLTDREKILVTNIQRFSLHDGPGIRTTIFFKGCLLNCPWCSNPENISSIPEIYHVNGDSGIYGKYMSIDDIIDEIVKDKIFYGSDGGVTYSGGEPLLQAVKIKPLVLELRKMDIHQCIETSLFIDSFLLGEIINFMDLFYVDIKILNANQCRSVINGDLRTYYRNLDILFSLNKNVIFRIPMIKPYIIEEENILEIINLVLKYKPIKIELIEGHNLAERKYLSLNKAPIYVEDMKDEDLNKIQNLLSELEVVTEICKI